METPPIALLLDDFSDVDERHYLAILYMGSNKNIRYDKLPGRFIFTDRGKSIILETERVDLFCYQLLLESLDHPSE